MGDATKAREKLGWAPTTVFEDLVAMMVKADFERVTKRGY
jgi:GDPmannose 4,6-dehydratase